MWKFIFGKVGSLLAPYKMQLIALLAVGVLAGLGWTHYKAYQVGVNADAANKLKVISKYQKRVAKLQQELSDERAAIHKETEKRITIIKKVVDPTGCTDTAVPVGILQQLDDSDN